jgi:hypothetical protein
MSDTDKSGKQAMEGKELKIWQILPSEEGCFGDGTFSEEGCFDYGTFSEEGCFDYGTFSEEGCFGYGTLRETKLDSSCDTEEKLLTYLGESQTITDFMFTATLKS